MFDTDLVTIPPPPLLSAWFTEQLQQDDEELANTDANNPPIDVIP